MKKIILISFFAGVALGAILLLFQQVMQNQQKLKHNGGAMKKVYMVKLVGGEAPNVEHETHKSAAQEAERLVKLYKRPAKILVTIAECRPAPEVIWEGEPQEITEE